MYNHFLDTFVCVVEDGSYNKASKRLFISPVAIKKQIDSLEESLGFPLFEKSAKGVTLTEAGNEFYEFAKMYIALSKREIEKISSKVFSSNNYIKILDPVYGNEIIKDQIYQKIKNNDVQVHFNPVKYEEEINLTTFNNLMKNSDVLLSPRAESLDKKYLFVPITSVPICALISTKNKLSKKKKVTLKDLSKLNVHLWRKGIYNECDTMRKDILKQYPETNIIDGDLTSAATVLKNFELKKDCLIIIDCWGNFTSALVTVPIEDYEIECGMYYKKRDEKRLEKFIKLFK